MRRLGDDAAMHHQFVQQAVTSRGHAPIAAGQTNDYLASVMTSDITS